MLFVARDGAEWFCALQVYCNLLVVKLRSKVESIMVNCFSMCFHSHHLALEHHSYLLRMLHNFCYKILNACKTFDISKFFFQMNDH